MFIFEPSVVLLSSNSNVALVFEDVESASNAAPLVVLTKPPAPMTLILPSVVWILPTVNVLAKFFAVVVTEILVLAVSEPRSAILTGAVRITLPLVDVVVEGPLVDRLPTEALSVTSLPARIVPFCCKLPVVVSVTLAVLLLAVMLPSVVRVPVLLSAPLLEAVTPVAPVIWPWFVTSPSPVKVTVEKDLSAALRPIVTLPFAAVIARVEPVVLIFTCSKSAPPGAVTVIFPALTLVPSTFPISLTIPAAPDVRVKLPLVEETAIGPLMSMKPEANVLSVAFSATVVVVAMLPRVVTDVKPVAVIADVILSTPTVPSVTAPFVDVSVAPLAALTSTPGAKVTKAGATIETVPAVLPTLSFRVMPALASLLESLTPFSPCTCWKDILPVLDIVIVDDVDTLFRSMVAPVLAVVLIATVPLASTSPVAVMLPADFRVKLLPEIRFRLTMLVPTVVIAILLVLVLPVRAVRSPTFNLEKERAPLLDSASKIPAVIALVEEILPASENRSTS